MKNRSPERVRQPRFTERSQSYHFNYSGSRIRMLRFGEGCQIYLADDFLTRIDIFATFRFFTHVGKEVIVQWDDVRSYSHLLCLIGDTIDDFLVEKTGLLRIRTESGSVLEYAPEQENVEPWNISDRDGLLVVGVLGGGVAVFMPDETTSRRRNIPGNVYFD